MEAKLTGREKQILRLIAQNLANKQISYELGLSVYTIESHCSKIYRKLNVSDRYDAVEIATEMGIITPRSHRDSGPGIASEDRA